jgi:hypothetical protein
LVLGQGIGELSGSLDVSRVDAEVDGDPQDTIRQLYIASFSRNLTSAMNFRIGLRYFSFDLEAAEAFGSFQEEIQPTGELAWTHPWFRFSATGSRRVSRSNVISGELVTDNALLNLTSAWRDTPEFNLRYELQNVDETGAGGVRDVKDRRLSAGGDYQRRRESFNYQFTRLWNENVVSGIKSTENSQRFLYRGQHDLSSSGRTTLASSYRYSRRDRVSEVGTGQRFLERVEPARGIGTVDPSPEQGTLPEVPGLIDGNTLLPVVPPLGIGSGQVDRNIGVDLGVIRDRVGAVYVYTDRLSGATVRWSVWISDDNLNWIELQTVVTSAFIPALSRYEIEFEETPARFIKVVNSGANLIADVQVTEIEVFESLPITEDVEEDTSSHLADARLVVNPSEAWRLSGEGVARIDPPSGTVSQRLEYNYALQARYRGRRDFTHILRWSQSWRDLEGTVRDSREDNATYTLLYEPLPTLEASLAGFLRQNTEGGLVDLRSANALLTLTALPWPALRSTAELGLNRVDQPIPDFLTDSWQTRLTIVTDLTRRLSANLTWLHQESYSGPARDHRVLRRVTFGAELQLTNAVFARARIALFEESGFSRSEQYLLSWRMFSRLIVTGQANLDENSSNFGSERYSINANLDAFDRFLFLRNVTAYVRFSDVQQTGAIESRILSWQYGVRATF